MFGTNLKQKYKKIDVSDCRCTPAHHIHCSFEKEYARFLFKKRIRKRSACGMRHAVVLRRRQPRARVRTRIGLGLCVGWVATFYGLLASGWKDLEEAMPMSCGQQVLQIPNDAWNAG